MTAAETRDAFNLYIDQYTTSRPVDLDFWIQQGIIFFIKSRVDPKIEYPDQGFQINQRARTALAPVLKLNVTVAYANGIITYPDDFYMLIPHSIQCTTEETAQKEVPSIRARARTLDWLYANEKNPFTKPKYKDSRLAYVEDENGINIYPNLVYTEVKMDYIKTWDPFSVGGDVPIVLNENVHEEVTMLAASKYLTSVHNYDAAKELLRQFMSE